MHLEETPIYWKNPEKNTFQVRVQQCRKEDEHFEVRLDQPVVRPEGGGQAGDRGHLHSGENVVDVFDVVDRHGETVLMCSQLIAEGSEAVLEIDMGWRRGLMQNHSAEHLFVMMMKSVRPETRLGYIWITGDKGVVDIHADLIKFNDLVRGEKRVNDVIDQGIPMTWKLVAPDELPDEVRARDGIEAKHEQIRVVSFGDLDSSACSGTHVSNTAEIGFFKVVDFRRLEDGVRVEFVTGSHAKQATTEVYNITLDKRHEYTFEMEQLGAIIEKSRILDNQLNLLLGTSQELLAQAIDWKRLGKVSFDAKYLPGFEIGELRKLIKQIPFTGAGAALFFVPDEKPSFIFVTNEIDKEAKNLIADVVEDLGGRGGGSRDVYTGGFSEVGQPLELYQKMLERIRFRLQTL